MPDGYSSGCSIGIGLGLTGGSADIIDSVMTFDNKVYISIYPKKLRKNEICRVNHVKSMKSIVLSSIGKPAFFNFVGSLEGF